jgi:formylglycine-generating enzyme required for sulfatase activity
LMFRLPTEQEWEYACRAGTVTTFSFGSDYSLLDHYGSHSDSSAPLHDVGQLRPNLRGLFDMHGNVREWCSDWLNPYGSNRVFKSKYVVRGGGGGTVNHYCRSAARDGLGPKESPTNIGCRLCVSRPVESRASTK